MEKIDKKKLALVLVFGSAILLFMNTNVFLPLLRKNKETAVKLKQCRDKMAILHSAFGDPEKLSRIKKEMDEMDEFLAAQIPEEKNAAGLTRLLSMPEKEFSLNIEAIDSKGSRDMKVGIPLAANEIPYQALALSLSLRAKIVDFIRYLNWLKTQKRLIGVESFSVSAPRKADGLAEIDLVLNGYTLSPQNFPYLDTAGEFSLDEGEFKKALTIPEQKDAKVSFSDIGEIFPAAQDGQEAKALAPEAPAQEKELALKGIVTKPNSAVAVINGQLLKKGQAIEGYKVIEIKKDKVILEKNGRQRVLELGKESRGKY